MKHTPGPWLIESGISSRVYLVNNRKSEAIGEIVYCDTRNSADARLIANAPALLEALIDLVNATGETFDNRHEMSAAIDVIAKATGEAV